jgi:hypothetical protein
MQIVTLTNQGVFMRFVLTIFQIVVKFGILFFLKSAAAREDEEMQGGMRRSRKIS